MNPTLGIRWTIGNVSLLGFEALRLSIWGAWNIFGRNADYIVCVNSLSLEVARERTRAVPEVVQWRQVTRDLASFIKPYLDGAYAEGVGWKFAPLQLFPDRFELALDNDCIVWAMPPGMHAWLENSHGHCLVAEDVSRCFGQFDALCVAAPRNSGIRGIPPGFNLEAALRGILEKHPVTLCSELDEQGLQMAALADPERSLLVTTEDVSACSPFPPHLPHLGRYGAHFVGLNAKQLPWSLNGRPAVEYIAEHWSRHRPALYEKVGLNLI
jgi:hypothetical protein